MRLILLAIAMMALVPPAVQAEPAGGQEPAWSQALAKGRGGSVRSAVSGRFVKRGSERRSPSTTVKHKKY